MMNTCIFCCFREAYILPFLTVFKPSVELGTYMFKYTATKICKMLIGILAVYVFNRNSEQIKRHTIKYYIHIITVSNFLLSEKIQSNIYAYKEFHCLRL